MAVIDLTTADLDLEVWADRKPTDEEVRLALRAVCVHAARPWQHGTFCLSCRAPYPCRLHSWGRRALHAAGWNDHEISAMYERFTKTWCAPWIASTHEEEQ